MGKFRKFFESHFSNSAKINLLEGGLGGHMNHPYDVLTPEDFIDFFDRLLTGKLDTTEKVDGVNLFVGFNKAGKLVFARNRTETPDTDISKKFPITHPGGDAFRAGFEALRKGLESLKPSERVEFGLIFPDGSPRAFINLEIIYGEIPNLIQYSNTDNFIVFHSLHGTEDQGYPPLDFKAKTLKDIANKIGKITVNSEVVSYIGPINNVKKNVQKANSNWIFYGQIDIPQSRIKSDLEAVALKFKHFPEFKRLKNRADMNDDELHNTMKSLAAKVGAEILINLSSQLFSGERKTGSSHPKIEGLVTKYKDSLIKITGDFAELNQRLWGPLRDGLDKIINDVMVEVFANQLKIPNITQIMKRTWISPDIDCDPVKFLMLKNKKEYKNGVNVNEKINKQKIIQSINTAFEKLQKEHDKILMDSSNVKQDDIIRALRIGGFKLLEFKKGVMNIDTRVELLQLVASTMFGL